jgi:hypothetical protein
MRCGGGRGASREAGGPVVWWRHDKRHARGMPDSRPVGAKGTRGAHLEHVAHVSDAGGVKAQRLVEGRRLLPSRGEGMRCGGERCKPGGERAWGVVAARQAACTGKGPTQGLGAKGTRGAHVEHLVHFRDAGGIKAQRLVEGPRVLPSRREGMRCGGRGASREAGGPGVWWRHDKRHAREKAQLKAWGPRARARSAPGTFGTCP